MDFEAILNYVSLFIDFVKKKAICKNVAYQAQDLLIMPRPKPILSSLYTDNQQYQDQDYGGLGLY